MTLLPPDHPQVILASSDTPHHSFWHAAGRWIGAGVLVLLVHAAGAYSIHAGADEDLPDGGEVAAMLVELAPVSEAPTEELASEMAQPETVTQIEEPVEPEEIVEEVPEPEPELATEPEENIPDIVEASKPEVALPVPAKKPEIKVKKPQSEKPKPVKQVQKPNQAEKAKETRKASAPQINADNGPKAVVNRVGKNTASAGVSSAKWTSKLQAHMARNVRLLQRRAGLNAKGLVQVVFVIDPSGNVLSARLAATSGNAAADQLALEAARRASPVPAPPTALAKARLPITLPLLIK